MADLEGFGEDPAADFLAREREDLGGIVDDTVGDENIFDGTMGGDFTSEPVEEPVSSNPYAAISQMDETPEVIIKWREEQAKMLKEKDDEELAAINELRTAAQKELTDWYNHYEDTLKHAKDANKQAEEAFIEERDEDIPGHEWERVARTCDFNPKSNKNSKDVSRMRSIFLQLKQTPPVH